MPLESQSSIFRYWIQFKWYPIQVDVLGCQNDNLGENEIYPQLLRCLDEIIEVKIELSTDKEI